MLSRSSPRRLPKTVLFTDIVGSTELAAQVGDRRWRQTVARHHTLVRRELRRHRGREVDTAGDGFFALFESPTDAVNCAAAVIAAVHGIGLRIRAGLHTGEVETTGEKAAGIAVHVGARLMGMAGPEEVLASSTVHDLVAGSGHEFEDRGEHELKGVPGRWRVFRLVLPTLDSTVATAAAQDEEAVLSRQRRLLVGAAGTVIAMVALLAAVVFVALRPPPPVTGSGALVAFAGTGPAPVAGWAVGRGPAALALDGERVWVANLDGGTLARVDMATGTVTAIGQVGTHPAALALAGGQIWVADPYTDRLSVIATDSGSLVRQIELHVSALTVDGGVVWAADDLRDRIVGLDPQTFAQTAEITLAGPAGPSSLASAGGALWAAASGADGAVRIDLASRQSTLIPLDIGPLTIVVAAGDQLWVASRSTDVVARLDAQTGREAARADVCDAPVAIAPFDGGAWVACATERSLWRIDSSGTVTDRLTLDGVPTAALMVGDRVWVSLRGD